MAVSEAELAQNRGPIGERRGGRRPPGNGAAIVRALNPFGLSPVDAGVTESLHSLKMQVEAGVAIDKSLLTSAKVCKNERGRDMFRHAGETIARGGSFDDALLQLADALSFHERAVISGGWEAGRPEPALASVIEKRKHLCDVRNYVRRQLAIPVLLLIVAPLIVTAVMHLQAVLSGTGSGLSLVQFLTGAFSPVGILITTILVLRGINVYMTRRDAGQEMHAPPPPITPLDSICLMLPVLNYVQHWRNRMEFAGMMATLLGAGISMAQSLRICSRALPNGYYRRDMQRSEAAVLKDGVSLYETLKDPHRWPSDWIAALEVGYTTGDEDKVFARLADHARDRYMNAVRHAGVIFARLIYLGVSLYIIYHIVGFAREIGAAYSGALN